MAKKSAMDMLKGIAKKEPEKKSKDASPILELENSQANRDSMLKWIEGKKQEQAGEAKRKQQEELLRPQCSTLREKCCLESKEFHSTIKVKVGDIGPVSYVTQNKYTPIPLSKEDDLQKEFGKEFELLFELLTEIKLTKRGLGLIEEVLPELVSLAKKILTAKGEKKEDDQEYFKELFEVEQSYAPTDRFHENRVLDPVHMEKAHKVIKDELVKPYSPSFRI